MQTEPTSTPQALAARVATLEREVAAGRRWRLAFAALAVVVVGMGAAGDRFTATNSADFGTIATKRVLIYNDEGEQVGIFGVPPAGESKLPIIGISAPDGRATLIRVGTPTLRGVDKDGKTFGN